MRRKKTKWMLCILILICLFLVLAILKNKQYNSQLHELELNDQILQAGAVCDDNLAVTIRPRGYESDEYGAWYHSYRLIDDRATRTRHAVGTIYELQLVNLTDEIVSDWYAKIYMPMDTMFNSGWNGTFEIHQDVAGEEKIHTFENSVFGVENIELKYCNDQGVLLVPMYKGDYFVYTPSESSKENRIDPSPKNASSYDEYESVGIGYIMYTEDQQLEFVIKFSQGSIFYKVQRGLLHEPMFWAACGAALLWLIVAIAMLCVAFYMKKAQKEKAAVEEMVHVFETDELTHTYTRNAFFHYADELMQDKDAQFGIAIVDMDGYKLTANQYGENICNEFLQYLADYLVKMFPDGYVGRFSESKYVIIDEIDENIFDVDTMIDEEMIKASPMPNQVLKVGVYAPVDKTLASKRCCDRAILALTKISGIYGQNISYYDDSLENQLIDDHKIEEYMEVALSEKQFEVYYQPKHDTNSKVVTGAEALVRWRHPKYGFMSPGQFIPIFERTGFISKIDAYVIEKVCEDIKQWRSEQKRVLPISVNVSRKDFYETGWIRNRLAIIEQYEINPQDIHMEITESLYASDVELIQDKMKQIQERGIKIEMDDFGSGYSSLGMLSSMTLDVLKLDISFIRHIDATEVVVESIIELAHKLGLTVIAEGVETQEQYDVIKKHGCDCIQGFYFAKPMSKDDFEKYIN